MIKSRRRARGTFVDEDHKNDVVSFALRDVPKPFLLLGKFVVIDSLSA